jgi:hypothetical protein
MAFAIVAHSRTETNVALAAAWRSSESYGVLEPREALHFLGSGDVVLARLDVRRTLDGVERGLSNLPMGSYLRESRSGGTFLANR